MNDKEIWEKANHVWQTGALELERLRKNIDRKVFTEVIRVIAGCSGRIITSGAGTSASAARKVAHSLSCIERPAFYLSPTDAVHGALGAVQPGDIAILISKGGGTAEIAALLPALRSKGVIIISVSENPDSVIGKASDYCLKVKIEKEADSFNMLATTSTMAVIAIFDAICIALMEYTGYSREQFLVIHPGGAVGERLAEKFGVDE
ncbi:MAG: SIS domain-containing protein [Spirochaetales bacterium]|uniref:SIS domain-containing protein n=1 Tax=Candidatus Thalassospirochaeta sargassi TaxID=3119039 RepID=A0AAJ1IIP1_9SPIO|nr:SIS domain-containing protein [Spirochaetales bacterium]